VWAANSFTVESKNVALGATGVQVGVFIQNDVNATAVVLPLELRSLTAGTYVTSSFAFAVNSAGRVNNSPLSSTGNNAGNPGGWPPASVTSRKYANPDLPQCSGPTSNSYLTGVAQIDFVSPDAIFYAAVSQGDPGIGEDIAMDPGADPPGTPSFRFTFNVTSVDGLFEIDSCCVKPANHASFVDDLSNLVPVAFTKSVIKVGNPTFPPVVTDIPDQTIDEGQSFATIPLDNYVSDLDDPDANITWTATGQSQLSVTISPSRVATIHVPNPDWFGVETITFTAKDPLNHTASDPATFTVNPVNDPPVLANITNKFKLAGQNLSFSLSGTDVDNTALTLSMLNAPAGASLTQDGLGHGTFDWPTVCADSGVYQVTFVVSDGLLADSQVVQITIQPNPDRFGTDHDTLSFSYVVAQTDPDSQMVIISDLGCGQMNYVAAADSPWVSIGPDSGLTPSSIKVDIDTAGLVAGDYTAKITLTQVGATGLPATRSIFIRLRVETEVCLCTCHADPPPFCDGEINIQSVIVIINVAFRGALDLGEATCPVSFADVNCDCNVDILDVVRIVDIAFRSGPPPCNPCTDVTQPCGLLAH
jgi:hypothetical protein